ncbi:MAG: hypothetical protein QG566_86 [Patescibacteria group bacterium]|jgi:hypothetical protein|nr:hypothetical protein [Patescibacteria group bacterium]
MEKIKLDIDEVKIYVSLAFLFILAIVTIPYWLPIMVYQDLNETKEQKAPTSWATQPNIFGEN